MLTARELEVLEAIRRGAHTYRAIARTLSPPVSPRTAQDLVYSIAGKIPSSRSPTLVRVILWAVVPEYRTSTDRREASVVSR